MLYESYHTFVSSSAWSAAKSIGGGFISSYALCSMKIEEASCREKGDFVWSTLNQACLAAFVAEQLFETLPKTDISSWIYSAAIGTVVLLNGKLASLEEPPFLTTVIHQHVGTVALIVSIACNIFFITSGAPLFGATSLLFLGVTLVEQGGYLPPYVHNTLFGSHLILQNGCRLILGGPLEQAIAVSTLAYYIFINWSECL